MESIYMMVTHMSSFIRLNVVQWTRTGQSGSEIMEDFDLSTKEIDAALAYYEAHQHKPL